MVCLLDSEEAITERKMVLKSIGFWEKENPNEMNFRVKIFF